MRSSYVQKIGQIAVASLVLAGACDHPIKTRAKNTINQDSVATPSGLTVESSQIDFGRTIIGTTPSQAVHISNTTGATVTLTISPLEGVDSQLFSTTPGAGSEIAIPDQESKAVLITYAPQVASDTPSQASFKLQQCSVGDGCSFGITLQGLPVVADVGVSPDPMDFGFVLTQTSATLTLKIGNQSSQAIHLVADPQVVTQNADGSAAATAMFSLAVGGPVNGATIEAGRSLSIDVTFSPSDTVSYPGEVFLFTDDALNPSFVVPLSGVGGGPSISCTPSSIDFGRHAAGMGVSQQVVCTNIGEDVPGHPESRLLIPDPNAPGAGLSIAGEDPAYQATFDQPIPATGLAAGDRVAINVAYNSTVGGQDSDALVIASNDPLTPKTRVALSGSALVLPACSYQILPKGGLSFGHVQSGTSATLPFAIANTGANDCLLTAVSLHGTSNPAFSLPDVQNLTSAGIIIHAGERSLINVQFAPTITSDSFAGRVDFTISDSAAPSQHIDLKGSSLDGCLVIQPGPLDFGITADFDPLGGACSRATRAVTIWNYCSGDIYVNSVTLLELSDPQEFVITPDPTPVVLHPLPCTSYGACFAPGPFTVQVGFAPTRVGADLGALQIATSDLADPYLIPLKGFGTSNAFQADEFTGHATAVDMLWVMDTDDDGSVQTAVIDGLMQFLSYPVLNGIDLHIATTSTDVYAMPSSEDGRLEPCPGCKIDGIAPQIVSSSGGLEPAVTGLSSLLALGAGYTCMGGNACNGFASDEQIFEAMSEALSPSLIGGYNHAFYRPDALLAVIAVNEDSEDDLSNAHQFKFYYDALVGLKGPGNASKVSFNYLGSVGGPTPSQRLGRMVALTGGVWGDFSGGSGGSWADELSALWPKLAAEIQSYPLSGVPEIATLQVSINGVALPAATGDAVSWTFDPASNSVRFDPLSRPQPGDALEISYTLSCGN